MLKAIGYVAITVKSFLQKGPDLDKVEVVVINRDCSDRGDFFVKNF